MFSWQILLILSRCTIQACKRMHTSNFKPQMKSEDIKDAMILRGELFPEPVEVITTIAMDDSLKLIATGVESSKTYQPILSKDQIDSLIAAPTQRSFNGDPFKFRLGVEAIRLGLAYEYDPYFSLSIARVDPLPHQLEAV